MNNYDKEYWDRLKQISDFYEYMDIYKDHLKVVSIVNNLKKKLPVDISKAKAIKIKYQKELKIINNMKNNKIEINNVIEDLIVLDNDLLYVALYKLCDNEGKEILKSLINAECNVNSDILIELIHDISKQKMTT